MFIAIAPLTIVLCAVFARVEVRYGKKRGERYTLIEIGHAAQNVLLQAQALGLGSVPVGAFEDSEVMAVLELPADHVPLYLLPIGIPALQPDPIRRDLHAPDPSLPGPDRTSRGSLGACAPYRQLLLGMDSDRVRYPRSFLENAVQGGAARAAFLCRGRREAGLG
jgi:hypothetical protein